MVFLRMRIRELISDKTSEVPACVDPPLKAESCHVTHLTFIKNDLCCKTQNDNHMNVQF